MLPDCLNLDEAYEPTEDCIYSTLGKDGYTGGVPSRDSIYRRLGARGILRWGNLRGKAVLNIADIRCLRLSQIIENCIFLTAQDLASSPNPDEYEDFFAVNHIYGEVAIFEKEASGNVDQAKVSNPFLRGPITAHVRIKPSVWIPR